MLKVQQTKFSVYLTKGNKLGKVMSNTPEILPWSEKYLTGIPEIDEQHKRLVHLVNLLATSITNQPDISYMNYIFTELTEYSMYHFQTEEDIWHEFFADDSWEAEHEEEHNNFVSVIISLEKEENTKPLGEVLENALSFLTHWLAHHILESDKRMAQVALAVQSGLSLEQAKQQANQNME